MTKKKCNYGERKVNGKCLKIRRRSKAEVLNYLKDTLRKGDIVMHKGKTNDGKLIKMFYDAEVV